MARRKRPKQQPNSASRTLDSLESRSERTAEWISQNPWPLLAVGVVILLTAAVWGFASQDNREEDLQASALLSQVEDDYRSAMGAAPGAIEIPEPANPEAARAIRQDFVAQFAEVTVGAPGTVGAALAQLEAGKLEQQLGDLDAAEALYQAGAESLPPAGEALQAFFLTRLASAHEAASEWTQAAQIYRQVSQMPNYPLSDAAALDAFRCYLEAGDTESARALMPGLEKSLNTGEVPAYLSAQINELGTAPGGP